MNNDTLLELREELDVRLAEIDHIEVMLDRASAGIQIVQQYLQRLKNMKPGSFMDQATEIDFYKNVSPTFYGHFIFYVRLFQVVSLLPPSRHARKKVFKQECRSLEEYFASHSSAYRYFSTGDTAIDSELFVYKGYLAPLDIEESACIIDLELCTPMGLKFAKFAAYKKLSGFFSERMNAPGGGRHRIAEQLEGLDFEWTDKKVYLEELTYALAFSNSINNGNAKVKSLARLFEVIFKIDLSNIYRAKQDMYTRKNASMYLDFLKKRFRDGLDETDDLQNFR